MNLFEDESMFYSWECVSIYRSNRTTLDFVIKDSFELMYLLHFLNHVKNKNADILAKPIGCLRNAKVLKMKMKISYQCWKQNIKPHDVFFMAV